MDVLLNRMQKEIQKAAWEFARGEFDAAAIIDMDDREDFPVPVWKKAAELGFIGLNVAEAYGGGGMGLLETVLVAETLCRKNSSMGIAIGLADVLVECLGLFGSEAQKQHHLPLICEGEQLCGICLNDLNPDAKDTVAICRTTSDGRYLDVSGQWSLVLNAPIADLYFLLCRDVDAPDPTQAYSLVMVSGQDDGVALRPAKGKLGMRLTPVGELAVRTDRIPLDSRLGRQGQGRSHLKAASQALFIKVAAMALGIAQGALDRSLNYARQRIQFRRKIGQFQVTRHKLARMAMLVEQARCLTYTAAARMDAKRPDPVLSTSAKLSACKAAVEVAYEAIQLHGGYGYTTEYEVERFYRDAKVLQLAGGNTHRIKDELANLVIGKIA